MERVVLSDREQLRRYTVWVKSIQTTLSEKPSPQQLQLYREQFTAVHELFLSQTVVKGIIERLRERFDRDNVPLGVRFVLTPSQLQQLHDSRNVNVLTPEYENQYVVVPAHTLERYDALRSHPSQKHKIPWLTICTAYMVQRDGGGFSKTTWDFRGNLPHIPLEQHAYFRRFFTEEQLSQKKKEIEGLGMDHARKYIASQMGIPIDQVEHYIKSRIKTCAGCHCTSANLLKCSGCKSVWYCDAKCQRLHWPIHKADCKKA